MNKVELVQTIAHEFRHFGYNALTLSQIAKVTGLGKASLYHHFPGGKEDMAIEVLKMARKWIEDELISSLENVSNTKEKLKIILEKLNTFYDSGKNYCLLDVMSTGNNSIKISQEIKMISESLVVVFKKIATEAGFSKEKVEIKVHEALCLIQGALILSRAAQDNKIFKRQIKHIENNFLL